MAANLRIGTPGIPAISAALFTSTQDSTHRLANLFCSHKADYFRAAAAASGDHRISFDLGASLTRAANFLYVGKATMLQKASVGTVTLKGHTANNYGAGTTVVSATSFGSATLYGPAAEDYITTFSLSSAYRYWWANYNATSASKVPHAKLFFGTLVDPGKDPTVVELTRTRPGGSRRKAAYAVRLEWEGLTYADTLSFATEVAARRAFWPFLLVTTTSHAVLDDHRVLFGRVTEFSSPPVVTNVNTVSLTFQELV